MAETIAKDTLLTNMVECASSLEYKRQPCLALYRWQYLRPPGLRPSGGNGRDDALCLSLQVPPEG
jgi:hypothetical protein